MGNTFCGCTKKQQSDENGVEHKKPVAPEPNKTQLSNVSKSESIENIHSSQEILDDDFKSQITKPIDEYIASVPTAYQVNYFCKNFINLEIFFRLNMIVLSMK